MNKQLLIGGAGGLSPVLVNLVALDANTMFASFDVLVTFGWLVRALILFIIGALVVYLNKEIDQLKAFQLGVMAPALITGYMNATNVKQPASATQPTQITQPTQQPKTSALFFITDVYAEPSDETVSENSLESFDKFLYGLTGNKAYEPIALKNYFVIAMTSSSREDIEQEIGRVKSIMGSNFDQEFPNIEIYAPDSASLYTLLINGNSLPYADALALQTKAINAGFGKDTWVWSIGEDYFAPKAH